MWKWLKSKHEPRKQNKYVEKFLKKAPSLQDTETRLLDEKSREYSLGVKVKRKHITIDLFRKIKKALKLKKTGKVYKSEQQIADKFRISQTTVNLMARAQSFKQYRELRARMNGKT